MNLRNWSKWHTFGMLTGFITPLILFPVVLMLIAWLQGFYFSQLWDKMIAEAVMRSKIISLSVLFNLIWFYRSLNRGKYDFAMGIILGSAMYLPYIFYVNLIM